MALLFGSEQFDRLFRRCLDCGDETPSCPVCDTGYVCSVSSISCYKCPSTSCVLSDPAAASAAAAASASASSSSSGPDVGAIAGGVIGGVALIAIVTYLVWRFGIKTRRQQYEQENWAEDLEDEPTPSDEKAGFTAQRDVRDSTYTVGSIASTVLTRASNIIQIAYIPGVTNRSTQSTPGLLVPPVPPIPIALAGLAGSTPAYDDQHFFMPGDLRDSTYSGISDRTSYARTSVASTIYGKNAIVSPLPAQTSKVIRGKAAVVSVGSKIPSSSHSNEVAPPLPSLDISKYTKTRPPSPAFSVGSTFLSNASAATAMRPTMVSVSSGSKGSALSKSENVSDEAYGIDVPYRDFPERPANHNSNRDTVRSSATITTFIDESSNQNSPCMTFSFGDSSYRLTESDAYSLSNVILEATRRASARPEASSRPPKTPFGDEHATSE